MVDTHESRLLRPLHKSFSFGEYEGQLLDDREDEWVCSVTTRDELVPLTTINPARNLLVQGTGS
jgi:hypothetical protein